MKYTIKYRIYLTLGNLCYRLNGGYDKVNNRSKLDNLFTTFMARACEASDKARFNH